MITGRPKKALILTAEEKAKLELLARRPKADQRTAERAGIVLDCAAGLSNTAVATKRRVTIQTVGKWRQRFVEGRLEALSRCAAFGPAPHPY